LPLFSKNEKSVWAQSNKSDKLTSTKAKAMLAKLGEYWNLPFGIALKARGTLF
jgi:hypothetical protein